jgi:hypothetical protein
MFWKMMLASLLALLTPSQWFLASCFRSLSLKALILSFLTIFSIGTGSFLVRRSSASYLSRLLSKILDSANSLAPVDLTLRALLRMGAVSGFLVVPLLGAPGWEQDEASTIQTDVDNAVRLSQRAHILLRLLASGIKSPFWCAQQLEEMYGVASPLAPDSDANDFLFYFDSLRGRMLAF